MLLTCVKKNNIKIFFELHFKNPQIWKIFLNQQTDT